MNMTNQQAQSLKDTLTRLLESYANLRRHQDNNLQGEMRMTLDPVREFFRPFLAVEYDQLHSEAVAAIIGYCEGDSAVAERFAESFPTLTYLRQQRDCFADGTRVIVPDAEKAVRILEEFLEG